MSFRENAHRLDPYQLYRRHQSYQPDQYRLWIEGRKIQGAVRLLCINNFRNGARSESDEAVWRCELACNGDVRLIGEYDLGKQLEDMEVIAWATSEG